MKRTPRSARRRARRQFAAKEPSAPFVPYISSTSGGSFPRSVSSGTLACMPERQLVLRDPGGEVGIVDGLVADPVEAATAPITSPWSSRVTPGGFER